MSVSRHRVLTFLQQHPNRPLKLRELARNLRVSDRDYGAFRRLMRQMTRDGVIAKLRGNRYGLPRNHSLATGRLSVHPDGYGLLSREDGEADVFIGARSIGRALHGDRVIVRITRGPLGSNRAEGELERILERAQQIVVGTFRTGVQPIVVSEDPRIPVEIAIAPGTTASAQDGQKVVARIEDWPAVHAQPEGCVIEVLGDPEEPGIETLILIKKHGLPLEFPPHVQDAAEAVSNTISQVEIERRLDLRDTSCFTIDPFDARDHDDAISLESLDENTYRLGIHIADVSHYVTEGSPLDHEALSRGTSVYLPDRVIPMLPERLSGGICSLRPHEDRLALSALITITTEGRVLEAKLAETVIQSRARLSYEEVQHVLDDHPEARRTGAFAFADTLKQMESLRLCLTEKRVARGAIDFEIPEPRVFLDAKGHPADIRPEPRLNSHRLIEEFMLLANEAVAQYMTDRAVPILYRVHERPDVERLVEFADLAASFGYRLPHPDRLSPGDIQRFLKTLHGQPAGRVLNHRLLRSMKKAVYTPTNNGHFGLACDAYTHFTSPIRRYPDLLTHRIVRDVLSGQRTPESAERQNRRLPDIGALATSREIAAQNAEWDAIKLMQAIYLEDKLGERFQATIVDVRPIGFFAQLDEVLIEGLVHVQSLNDDYYVYNKRQGNLVGERSGTAFQMGDPVEVQLAQVDRQRLRIDFTLASHKQRAQTRPPRRSGKSRRRRRRR